MGLLTVRESQITAFFIKSSFQVQSFTSQGVSKRVNSEAASLSKINSTFSDSCRNVAGTKDDISPSTALFTMDALFLFHARRMISLALKMVPTPMVMALTG